MTLYLGIVTRIDKGLAYLNPKYKIDNDKQEFIALAPNLSQELVIWKNPPVEAIKDTLWTFNIDTDAETKLFYVLTYHQPFIEIINFQGYNRGSFIDIVKEVKEIILPSSACQQAYLWLDQNIWAGPVNMTLEKQGARHHYYCIDYIANGFYLPLVSLLEERFITLNLFPGRKFLSPWTPSPAFIGYIDLTTYNLIDKIPEKIPELESQHTNISAIQGQRQNIKITADTKRTTTMKSKNLARTHEQNKPDTEKETLDSNIKYLQTKIETFSTNLEQYQREHKQLNDMKDAIAQHQIILKQLQQEIKEAREAHQKELATLHEIIKGTVHQQNKPGKSLWAYNPKETAKTIIVHQKFHMEIRKAFTKQGFAPNIATILHSSFLAGVVPTLVGEDAFSILQIYADLAARGRSLWIPISPTQILPTDLIGTVDIAHHIFVPHQSGLADLLLDAQEHTDNLYLVVLEGINKAAIDTYLMPLLTCYIESAAETQIHSLHIFHPATVNDSDPYNTLHTLHWPKNVLLATTLADGVSVFPPPPSFWDYSMLINMDIVKDDHNEQRLMQPRKEEKMHSMVSVGDWTRWNNEIQQNTSVEDLEEIDWGTINTSRLSHKLTQQFSSVLLKLNSRDIDVTNEQILFHSLLPKAIATDQIRTLLMAHKDYQKEIKQQLTKIRHLVEQFS
ncbi:hypothetical protein KDW_39270 [Dictyobacter vulcani]|uniref:Uncharacterized protein n=1 Tax=Dictyobacter vulcani TaxID=2607529 RepID=A0A5J4KPF5_9CHLR|nr:hypothetical protein [Dictyobacter vulcani]GER89765.1 hypothetical protein KDW_39270 [Dictyobacter vulcani]